MSGFSLNVALDAASMERVQVLQNYPMLLEPALENAMEAGLTVLQNVATDYMDSHFIQTTGGAEEAWEPVVHSPYLAELGNTAPYAQRLEFGFSGKTDILGRYYPYWPDYHWAEHTVELAADTVADDFRLAIDAANDRLAGGGTP